MAKITFPKLAWYWRIADILMVPVMFVLRGCRLDSLQETHTWHPYKINATDLDLSLTVETKGTDTSQFNLKGSSFLFHAPIFGGWTNFSVYEVDPKYQPFYIGWVVEDAKTGKFIESKIHRLPIYDNQIRMLDGPAGQKARFFAVDQTGSQIPLKVVGHGRLNDGQYLNLRLF